ncbi:hypothetical protein A2936_02125 [Candidatus Uhrbacteria bacterium RIFCSPLOWO2_01_FULL_47_25]|uniref:PIN domain-containing protein n=2 Tax=Patescibacteria group TaxID=1783273 RepID=A0A1F7UUB8_9BACT|nr:MAG: hypothetical protein A2693_03890 [Candidatus Curtissbacteria bacterium RIFCSPHIGHO2_01_FULL_40_12]OGL81298.1 MAG: hypothetical protein A2936_02125 [Candidatus Uhrbacteria bacterium RIFCSPLOWO2_01_FULL_47_25]
MRLIKAFLDSDVIISSLLSSTGAAYLLTRQKSAVKYISNLSVKEIHIVARRLAINSSIVDKLLRRFKLVRLKKDFGKDYVNDPHDQHVISGAVTAKARFLLTYNLKHFKVEKIKRDFNILVYQPAQFLQYLRSL